MYTINRLTVRTDGDGSFTSTPMRYRTRQERDLVWENWQKRMRRAGWQTTHTFTANGGGNATSNDTQDATIVVFFVREGF